MDKSREITSLENKTKLSYFKEVIPDRVKENALHAEVFPNCNSCGDDSEIIYDNVLGPASKYLWVKFELPIVC